MPPAGAKEISEIGSTGGICKVEQCHTLGSSRHSTGLRAFQPPEPYRRANQLRDMPRRDQQHVGRNTTTQAEHGMVPELPPEQSPG